MTHKDQYFSFNRPSLQNWIIKCNGTIHKSEVFVLQYSLEHVHL